MRGICRFIAIAICLTINIFDMRIDSKMSPILLSYLSLLQIICTIIFKKMYRFMCIRYVYYINDDTYKDNFENERNYSNNKLYCISNDIQDVKWSITSPK